MLSSLQCRTASHYPKVEATWSMSPFRAWVADVALGVKGEASIWATDDFPLARLCASCLFAMRASDRVFRQVNCGVVATRTLTYRVLPMARLKHYFADSFQYWASTHTNCIYHPFGGGGATPMHISKSYLSCWDSACSLPA